MIVFNKLYCQLNENTNFNTEIRQVFGVGSNNNLYKKFGLARNSHTGVIKIVDENLEFDIEYYILRERFVSFPLKQEIKDNIRKKIIKRIYEGYRHQKGLPVRGQRTHSNCKTVKKTYNKNIVLSTGFKTANLFRKRPVKQTGKKKILLKPEKGKIRKKK
jgi:small subunit ribosomal protein S13